MKKHKKHKGDRKDRYDDVISEKPPALKLILKVGGGSSSTPEHSDSPGPVIGPSCGVGGANYSVATLEDESSASLLGVLEGEGGKHKKAKKKKKKKDRDREKHGGERKHKHHHKERKKRPREESSQEDGSVGEESSEVPAKKPALAPVTPEAPSESAAPAAPTPSPQAEPANQQPAAAPAETGEGGEGQREPRTCVLRQRQEKNPLYKLLDHLLKLLEKKDPQHFFAWPVTDNIAPGYSSIISQPMDFSTMRQKNEETLYTSLPEFIDDFKLMCQNAMVYNQAETVYYRAAKRLLHGGLKVFPRDKLRQLLPSLPCLGELSTAELGFELHSPEEVQRMAEAAAAAAPPVAEAPPEASTPLVVEEGEKGASQEAEVARVAEIEEARREARRRSRAQRPLSKFEAIPDDLSPEEILVQVRRAAQGAADKLAHKKPYSKMGFLRTNKDGTTSLAILCGNTGVAPGSNEQPISLGSLAGKLPHGTGQLAGFREDKRNVAKTVKPLYYGAFGSYAPSYDSTFANLSKEESDLVYSTYGDETGFQYAESILDFARDSDYTLRMVDDLLDLLTGGEHSRTVTQLGTARRKRPDTKKTEPRPEDAKLEATVDVEALKSLADLGINTDFLEHLALPATPALLTTEAVQASLDQTSQLIGQLQKVQRDRLSQPPPPHLALTPGPSESEVQLAEKITDNLTDLAKQVTPDAIAPACVVRKAMGVDMIAAPPPAPKKKEEEVPDLESELRDFLENTEPTLSSSPLQDEDRTIEEILSES